MGLGPQATQAAEEEVVSQEERHAEPESGIVPSVAQLTNVRTPTASHDSCFGSDCLHISLQGTLVGWLDSCRERPLKVGFWVPCQRKAHL